MSLKQSPEAVRMLFEKDHELCYYQWRSSLGSTLLLDFNIRLTISLVIYINIHTHKRFVYLTSIKKSIICKDYQISMFPKKEVPKILKNPKEDYKAGISILKVGLKSSKFGLKAVKVGDQLCLKKVQKINKY